MQPARGASQGGGEGTEPRRRSGKGTGYQGHCQLRGPHDPGLEGGWEGEGLRKTAQGGGNQRVDQCLRREEDQNLYGGANGGKCCGKETFFFELSFPANPPKEQSLHTTL